MGPFGRRGREPDPLDVFGDSFARGEDRRPPKSAEEYTALHAETEAWYAAVPPSTRREILEQAARNYHTVERAARKKWRAFHMTANGFSNRALREANVARRALWNKTEEYLRHPELLRRDEGLAFRGEAELRGLGSLDTWLSYEPSPDASETRAYSPELTAMALGALYDASPRGEGFVMHTRQAQPVRDIGERLNEIGGFELMLRTHEAFASHYPFAARNLEMVWDGIGSWRG